MKKKTYSKKRHYNTLIEGIIVMLLFCLILFGLIQVFLVVVAQMMSDYSAFASARSAAVGFSRELVDRSARVGAIAASGPMLYPATDNYQNNIGSQFYAEKVMIPDYLSGVRRLEYKHSSILSQHVGNNSLETLTSRVEFNNYPLEIPMWQFISNQDGIDINGNATIQNHSRLFLE